MTRTSKAAWKKRRLRILDRDGWRCVLCSAASRLEVDHRIPLQDGGLEEDSNLRALCRSCHIARHRKPRSAAQRAWDLHLAVFLDASGSPFRLIAV